MEDDCTGVPDLLDRLGEFITALDVLLDRTGPNAPPGFEAAIRNAENEHWADEEARETWDAMLRVRNAHGGLSWPVLFSVNFFSVEVGRAVARDFGVPLKRAHGILEGAWTRWGMDCLGRWRTEAKTKNFAIADGLCWYWEPGEREPIGGHGWSFEIPAPDLDPAEHEALVGVRAALKRRATSMAEREVAQHVPILEELDSGEPMAGDAAIPADAAAPTDDISEADVEALKDKGWGLPAKLVKFMLDRDSATFEEAAVAVYGDSIRQKLAKEYSRPQCRENLRKVKDKVNLYLKEKKSRLSFKLGRTKLTKERAVE